MGHCCYFCLVFAKDSLSHPSVPGRGWGGADRLSALKAECCWGRLSTCAGIWVSQWALTLEVGTSLSLFFFWLHLWHVEVPGPGIEPVP